MIQRMQAKLHVGEGGSKCPATAPNEGTERGKIVMLTVQTWGTHYAKQGVQEKVGQDWDLPHACQG
jgi:hypothetical protein